MTHRKALHRPIIHTADELGSHLQPLEQPASYIPHILMI